MQQFRVEYYPHKAGRMLMYRLVAPPTAFAPALEEFQAARKTISSATCPST